jgi:hypothetical protein
MKMEDKMKMKLDYFLTNYQLLYKKNKFPTIEVGSFEDFKNNIEVFWKQSINEFTIYAWEVIIDNFDESYLFDELLNFLIVNDLGLEFLGHKNLSSDYLLKIYHKSNISEALTTIYNRYLSDDRVSNEQFIDFIKNNYNKNSLYFFCSDIYINPILTESEYNKALFLCNNFSNYFTIHNSDVNILKLHLQARNTSSNLVLNRLAKSNKKEIIQGLLYNPKLTNKLLDKIILNNKNNILMHDLLLLKIHLNK